MARLKEKYKRALFNGKPVFPPRVRGLYGETKLGLNQSQLHGVDPRPRTVVLTHFGNCIR